MKFQRARWMAIIFVSALATSASPKAARAQAPAFQDLPKVLDASVPRDLQMSIALSAGPKEVSSNATIYILGAKGLEKVREGTNGATCLVGRHFIKPTETTIEPMCYDPEGSQSLFPAELYKEELRSKGTAEPEIKAAVAAAFKDGRFKAPTKPGVLYMLSSDNRLGPTPAGETVHVPPHFMFYAPYMTGKDLGYAATAPFLTQPGEPEAKMIVFPDPSPKFN